MTMTTSTTRTTPLREQVLEVAGIRTPVIECAPDGCADATEAVVFVHGNPGPRDDWDPLVRSVGSFARAVAWDHPGYGRADRPRTFDHTVEGYARQLDRVLAVLGIERAHLVLHDFGGPWGLRWAAEHPDRVASLVLVNTGVLFDYRWHTLARIWRTPVVGEVFMATTVRPMMQLVVNRNEPRPLPRSFFDTVFRHMDRGHRRAVRRLYRSVDDPSVVADQLADALLPHDHPTLVVWGRHDAYLPERLAADQRRAFPTARVELLDGSGHWPHIDAPDVVEPLVTGFLAEQLGVAGSGHDPCLERSEASG
jgi:pimeloyl-ACP methyl ester carboxylesterase